jgi:RNAse (barnase) inhibitor barstar
MFRQGLKHMAKNATEKHFAQLDKIRSKWCRRPQRARSIPDRSNVTVVLDGSRVSDIPTFYIALGEAVNGPDGYYGGGLDALDDCLCGKFGLVPPFTLESINLGQVQNAVESTEEAWSQMLVNQ